MRGSGSVRLSLLRSRESALCSVDVINFEPGPVKEGEVVYGCTVLVVRHGAKQETEWENFSGTQCTKCLRLCMQYEKVFCSHFTRYTKYTVFCTMATIRFAAFFYFQHDERCALTFMHVRQVAQKIINRAWLETQGEPQGAPVVSSNRQTTRSVPKASNSGQTTRSVPKASNSVAHVRGWVSHSARPTPADAVGLFRQLFVRDVEDAEGLDGREVGGDILRGNWQ